MHLGSKCTLVHALIAFAIGGVLMLQPAAAAVYTWNGGGADANWTTAGNWDGGAAPAGVNTDQIRMAGTVGLAPVVDGSDPRLLNDLLFNSGAGAFTLSGNTLRFAGSAGTIVQNSSSAVQTINNPIVVASGSRTVSAGSGQLVFGDIDLNSGSILFRGGQSVTINGLVTGSGSLNRTDPGTVIINNNNNTFSGNVYISHGAFQVASIADAGVPSALGTGSVVGLGQGTWGPSDTGTLRYTGPTASTNRTIEMRGNATSQAAGIPSGRPTLEVTNSGTTLTFNGNFQYASGSFAGRHWRLIGAGNGVINGNITTTDAGILKDGTGTWTLAGNNTYSGVTTIDRGRLNISHPNALGTTAGETIINGNDGAGAATLGISGNITVAEPITLNPRSNGRAYLRSSGDNTLTGAITLTGGVNPANLWSDTGMFTVAGDIAGSSTHDFGVRGNSDGLVTGSIDIGSTQLIKTEDGTWTIGAAGNTYNWGNTIVARGMLRMGAADVTPAGTVLTIGQNDNGNATFDLNGFNQSVAGLVHVPGTGGTKSITNSAATAATLTVGISSDYSFGGHMTGNLGLTKSGTGTLTLEGNSSHTGATTISGGTLALSHGTSNNTIAASPLIEIQAGAFLDVVGLTAPGGFVLAGGQTLKGEGTLVGSLTAAAGSTVAPGASPGMLTIQGDFLQEADSVLQIELAGTDVPGTDYDVLDVYGDASLAGRLDVSLLGGFTAELGDYFDVLTTTGSLDIGGLSLTGDAPNPVFGWWEVAVLGGGDGATLRLSAVPEPGTWLLLLAAGACGLLVRRRR